MSKATRQIKPEDIPDVVTSHLVFAPLDKWKYQDEDDYDQDDEVITSESLPSTVKDIAKQYDISLDVAKKISKLQAGVKDDLDFKVQNMLDCSERYLQVKPYLGNSRYDNHLLYEYVVFSRRSSKFMTEMFSPSRNLRNAFIAAFVSLTLLTGFIATTIMYLDGKPLTNNIPAFVFATVWLLITIYSLSKSPRRYYTRRFIMKLYKDM